MILACVTPSVRPTRLDEELAVTPPPAAQRLAREALLLRVFRPWPKRVNRHLAVEIAAGRRVRAWEVHRAFKKGGISPLLGGVAMFHEIWRAGIR